jgi:DNA-binding winged helix-turn-helix (wHTH) protein
MRSDYRKVLGHFAVSRPDPPLPVTFGPFVLDRGARQLLRGIEERRLGPKGFELLLLLLDQRPNVVPRERIRERLWPGTFISESTLATLVAELRAALGEDARRPTYLRTVHGVGFAFCGTATETGSPPAAAAASTAYRLVLKDREVRLHPGENLLGRVENGVVWLASPTVSRRHARIVVDGSEVVLEDLGSKNGTFVREQRITSPTALSDGDTFRLGHVEIELRVCLLDEATRTDDAR